jgi:hypothetical protein
VASYYNGPRVWHGDGQGHWQEQSKGLPRTILGGLFRRTPPAEDAQKAEGDKDGSNKDNLPRMQVWINEDVKG